MEIINFYNEFQKYKDVNALVATTKCYYETNKFSSVLSIDNEKLDFNKDMENSVNKYINNIKKIYPDSVNKINNTFMYLLSINSNDSLTVYNITNSLIDVAKVCIGKDYSSQLTTSLNYAISNKLITNDDELIIKPILSSLLSKSNKTKTGKICIDPGHGMPDTGVVSLTNINESDINLAISKLLKKSLENCGYKVKLTRTGSKRPIDNKALDLKNRAKISNDYTADLFISLHCNSSENIKDRGFSVIAPKDDANSINISNFIYYNINNILNDVVLVKDNILCSFDKEHTNYMFNNINATSIVVYPAYISNSIDTSLLNNEEYNNKVVDAITLAVETFMNI